MLLLIFGAGASYDSMPEKPANLALLKERMPLANELFDARFGDTLARWPQIKSLVPYLQQRSQERSVESVLEELVQQAKGYPPMYGKLNAMRYYLQDLITNAG